MFAKTTTLFALFTVAARLVAATPPACLIAAVNTQPDPSALKAVCSGSNATAVEEYICKNCSSNAADALSAFASVCSSAGVTIDNSTSCSSTSSSSSSASKTSSASGTGSTTVAVILTTGSSGTGTSAILIATGTAGGSSGFATATGGSSGNGTLMIPPGSAPTATSSSGSGSSGSGSGSGGSGSSSSPSASTSSQPANNAAARLGMDILGLAAVGAFGLMLAF
ncbi:hypothetical protein LTS10_001007 [Elasticomyces elasticus]|nr:hypothetical protein LTS10_001007 [Elasticomyces elasticus]